MVAMDMAGGLMMLSLDMTTNRDMELHSVHVSKSDHGYGYNPASYTYGFNIGHGYGKKSADAGYSGGASSYVHQTCPYYHGSIAMSSATTSSSMDMARGWLK